MAKTAPKTRTRSELTLAGERAAAAAKRDVLLTACRCCDWNLSRVAEKLALTSASDVLRALKELAPEDLAAARKRGDVSTQNRA